MHEREAVHAVATLYYVQNETMASIAARLDVSRSTVSRMLEQARESGIVDIKVNPVDAGSPFAEMALKSFGIRVALGLGAQKRDDCASARVAARLLADCFDVQMILGVAWERPSPPSRSICRPRTPAAARWCSSTMRPAIDPPVWATPVRSWMPSAPPSTPRRPILPFPRSSTIPRPKRRHGANSRCNG